MSTVNDGGPAFPHGPLGDTMQGEDGRVWHQYPAGTGMTLRAYFASLETLSDYDNPDAVFTKEQAVALIGRPIPAFKDALGVLQWEAEWRAALKVMRADALIKALNEGGAK